MRCALSLLAVLVAWLPAALAVNLSFIEGDAFFHAQLTEKALGEWEGGGLVLEYADTTPTMVSGCGNAGSMKLRVVGDTTSVLEKLKSLYGALREAYPKKLVVYDDGTTREINGFHLFVYNRDIDFSNREVRLGIKYNEDWVERFKVEYDLWSGEPAFSEQEQVTTDYYTDYETFIDSKEAVIHDWKMGSWVAPLKIQAKKDEESASRTTVEVADVQFIVVPRKQLKPYFNLRPKRNFYSILGDGITVYRLTKDGVNTQRLDKLESVQWMEWGEE